MFKLMSIGAVIEIKPYKKGTENFVSSKFWMKAGEIWCSNEALGTFPRPEMTEETFTEHLQNMINDGFQIEVKPA